TRDYHDWLRAQGIPLIEDDLRRKRKLLKENPFTFLRGTFYRWAEIWPRVAGEQIEKGKLAGAAPSVCAVGDLHVENFGTWRDAEGRLVWGINDFDESFPLPYTHDLVRLATSVLLVLEEGRSAWRVSPRNAVDSILSGYTAGLAAGGTPFVLD